MPRPTCLPGITDAQASFTFYRLISLSIAKCSAGGLIERAGLDAAIGEGIAKKGHRLAPQNVVVLYGHINTAPLSVAFAVWNCLTTGGQHVTVEPLVTIGLAGSTAPITFIMRNAGIGKANFVDCFGCTCCAATRTTSCRTLCVTRSHDQPLPVSTLGHAEPIRDKSGAPTATAIGHCRGREQRRAQKRRGQQKHRF